MPHVFSNYDLESAPNSEPSGLTVNSLCCGPTVSGAEPIGGDWEQPFPCFMGWHTTDVDTVKEQYNGVNFLRCDPGRGGKCRREEMQHRAHYENIFDGELKYNQIDKEDQKKHLKRIREDPNVDEDELDYMSGESSEDSEDSEGDL